MSTPRYLFYHFSFLVLSFWSLRTSAQIVFQKAISGTSGANSYSIRQTADNGFIVAGSAHDVTGNENIFLIKLDEWGGMQWSKSYGDTTFEQAYSVQQTTDGGYIVAGRKMNGGINNAFLMKTDGNGVVVWSKLYGGVNDDMAVSVTQLDNGGYAFMGVTSSFGATPIIFLCRTDNQGAVQWTKTYNNGGCIGSYCVRQTSNGGFVMTSCILSGNGDTDMLLMRTDNTGALIWAKTYGGINDDEGRFLVPTSDNGFIVLGTTVSFGISNFSAYLVKASSNGTMQWSKTFSNLNTNIYPATVHQTNDDGYVLAGFVLNFITGLTKSFLLKTDSTGAMSWAKYYGGSMVEDGRGAAPTSDHGMVLTGKTNMTGTGDFYVVKTDAAGMSGCFENPLTLTSTTPSTTASLTSLNTMAQTFTESVFTPSSANVGVDSTICVSAVGISEYNKKPALKLFPNPAGDNFTVLLNSEPSQKEFVFSLYDATGKRLRRSIEHGSSFMIDIRYLESGVYFIEISAEDQFFDMQKLVVQ